MTEGEDRHRLFALIQRNELFSRMVRHQGLDFSGTWWRGFEYLIGRALGRCARCPQPGDCRNWLDQTHATGAYPSFCPNTTIIEACRIMDPGAPGPGRLDTDEWADIECDLAEILDDPLVRQMMAADNVDADTLRAALLDELRAAIAQPATRPS